jgi:hypothetical protein
VPNPMRELAEDLNKLLVDIKPKPVIPPSVTEQHDVRQVSRAVLEYVLQKAPEDILAEEVGAGLAIGIQTAAQELNLKEADLLKGIESFMADALKAARASLAAK